MLLRWMLCIGFALSSTVVSGDEPARLPDQPIAILRIGGIDAKAAESYFANVRNDLGVGQKLAEQIAQQEPQSPPSRLDRPASGLLVYLEQGLLPAVQQVQFSQVADHEEFVRLVNQRGNPAGASGKLEGSGDLYSLVVTNTWRVPEEQIQPVSNSEVVEVPQAGALDSAGEENDPAIGVDETTPAATSSVSISIGTSTGSGVVVRSSMSNGEGKLIEEDGRKFREYSSTTASYFRYHEGFLFESQTKALYTMNLPAGDYLRQMENADVGGEVVFHPDRIPMGLRMLGWNALSTAAGAELQQRDDEKDDDYAVRRGAGDAGLALIRSLMFDTEKVSATGKLPFDENPVQGEFRISSRKNSDLGRVFRELNSAERRFAPILKDDAAATIYLATHLPEEWRKVLSAYLGTVSDEIANSTEHSEAERASQLTWLKSLASITEHGNVELCAKVGWTKESGGVIYGGVQLNDNPELLPTLLSVVNEAIGSGEANDIVLREMVEHHDISMLKMTVPADIELEWMKLTHVYLANVDSCVWFAVGGENSHEIIHQSVERCRAAGGRISAPIFTATVDLQQWANYPQDDVTGLTVLHQHWYSATSSFAAWMLEDFLGEPDSTEDAEKNTSRQDVFERGMNLGGSKVISLTVDSDESGLVARGSVGEAMVRGYAAAAMVTLEELMESSMDDAETPAALPTSKPSE